MTTPRAIDVTIRNEGELALVEPQTDAAAAWLRAHVEEAATWRGNVVVVDYKYLIGLLHALFSAGFLVGKAR